MSRKLAILFTVLAITYVASAVATVGTASPSSAYSIAPAVILTNATDTAFTNLPSNCWFTAGFDNTTNYIWCTTMVTTGGAAPNENSASSFPQSGYTATYTTLALERRTINASSPATKNATLDLKITTSITANDGAAICGGVGYLGIAYGFGSGASDDVLASDVSLAWIAVNGTAATTLKLTTGSATVRNTAQACMFDNGIFYVIFTTDGNSQTTPVNTANKYMIQGVNTTSGNNSIIYAAGGVAVLTQTSASIGTYSNFKLTATNWTGYGSSMAILTYTDSSSYVASATTGGSTVSTGSTYKAIPITLATGAPGSAVSLGTTGTTTTIVTGTEATPTTTTTIANTYWSTAGVFGSLTTYGVVASKRVDSIVTKTEASNSLASTATPAYSAFMFLNGSTTASTTFNMTLPTGFYLGSLTGYSTSDGFGLISEYLPVATAGTSSTVGTPASAVSATVATNQWNKDTYFVNGTAILSAVSLGTFDNGYSSLSATAVSTWLDAAGSPWLGYVIQDTSAAWTGLDLISAYAGEIVYNPLSGNVLSTIFATLTFLIAALFAF